MRNEPQLDAQPRTLVLVEGKLGERLAGPEIRALGLARLLRNHSRVTLAARRPRPGTYDGFAVVPFRRHRLVRELRRHDAVVSPWIPPYLYAVRGAGTRLIADLYDPFELELLSDPPSDQRAREIANARRLEGIQLRHADGILCATERQRDRLTGMLPRGSATRVAVVPFGIDGAMPAEEPASHPLRERFGLDASHTVVLWWGALWHWLDPVRAVEAVALLARRRKDIRLVLTAGTPPDEAARAKLATDAAMAAAEQLGVLGSVVHFLDEWVPFGERHRHLRDADIGITLDRAEPEAPFAIRARILDYVWAGLPTVLSGGDVLSEQLGEAGAAAVVGRGGAEEVARALERLLEPAAAMAAREALVRVRPLLAWTDADRTVNEIYSGPAHVARMRQRIQARFAVLRYYAGAVLSQRA